MPPSDDATRPAYVEVLDDEKGPTAAGFLRRAVRFFSRWGIHVERVLTDNGSCYRAVVHALACKRLGDQASAHAAVPAAHQRQGRALHPDVDRRLGLRRRLPHQRRTYRTLAGWLDWYNRLRPHRSLGRKPPLTRLAEMNNVV